MKRKTGQRNSGKKSLVLVMLGIVVFAGCSFSQVKTEESGKPAGVFNSFESFISQSEGQETEPEETEPGVSGVLEPEELEIPEAEEDFNLYVSEMYFENGIMTVNGIPIVNKKHPVPSNYHPGENEEAKNAFMQLASDMASLGYDVSVYSYSGYRSYETQSQLYNNYVAANGQMEADRFSARPGFSEHQTGLAFDVMHSDGSLMERQAEVDWLAEHAADYGFIIRYPQDKEVITGYMYEPWHIRYIGALAADIAASGLTLEEYLAIPGGDYF